MKRFMGVVAVICLVNIIGLQPVAADDNAEAFAQLDKNGDGKISKDEAESHPDLPNAFTESDMNDDGFLDAEEFAKADVSDE